MDTATLNQSKEYREVYTGGAAKNVDREQGVIRDVKILGHQSKNGGFYPGSAMEAAKSLYEGAHVNIDHPERSEPDAEREFNEWFGVLENVRVEPDGMYGDLKFLTSHPLANQVCEAAERFPDKFGLSHNAQVTEADRDGRTVYEAIHRVRSVDVVCKPATTKSLFESEKTNMADPVKPDAIQNPNDCPTPMTPRMEEGAPGALNPGSDPGAPAAPDASAVEVDPDDANAAGVDDPLRANFQSRLMALYDAKDWDGMKAFIDAVGPHHAALSDAYGTGNVEEGADNDNDDDDYGNALPPSKGDAGMESIARRKSKKESVRMKRENSAMKSILESVGVTVTPERLRSLSAVTDAEDQKALIARWRNKPASAAAPVARPKSTPLNAIESQMAAKPATNPSDELAETARLLRGY